MAVYANVSQHMNRGAISYLTRVFIPFLRVWFVGCCLKYYSVFLCCVCKLALRPLGQNIVNKELKFFITGKCGLTLLSKI
jgi:hypothetical protein